MKQELKRELGNRGLSYSNVPDKGRCLFSTRDFSPAKPFQEQYFNWHFQRERKRQEEEEQNIVIGKLPGKEGERVVDQVENTLDAVVAGKPIVKDTRWRHQTTSASNDL